MLRGCGELFVDLDESKVSLRGERTVSVSLVSGIDL